jgi:hypothetical protein
MLDAMTALVALDIAVASSLLVPRRWNACEWMSVLYCVTSLGTAPIAHGAASDVLVTHIF